MGNSVTTIGDQSAEVLVAYEKDNLASKEPEKLVELTKLLAAEQSKDNPVQPPDLDRLPH